MKLKISLKWNWLIFTKMIMMTQLTSIYESQWIWRRDPLQPTGHSVWRQPPPRDQGQQSGIHKPVALKTPACHAPPSPKWTTLNSIFYSLHMVSLRLLPQVWRLHVKVFHYGFLLCDDYMNMGTFHSLPPVWCQHSQSWNIKITLKHFSKWNSL